MLCNNCSNRNICKYYAFFADAPMIINIESCEKYISKEQKITPVHSYPETLRFKEPIDYSKFNIANTPPVIEKDEDERITVDLSEDHSDKIVSITDILLGNEGEDK